MMIFTTVFIVCWNIENIFGVTENYRKMQHDATNFGFILPGAVIQLLLGVVFVRFLAFENLNGYGLLAKLGFGTFGQVATVFVVLDFTYYLYHFLMHKIKSVWRFHAVHHSDPVMNVSTSLREHPVETGIRVGHYMLAVWFLAPALWIVTLHQFVQILTKIIIHSNFRLPEKVDKYLSLVLLTPNMHHVHHHDEQPYTDSNFGDLFSIWDRMFGTFRHLPAAETHFGLDTAPASAYNLDFKNLMTLPFDEKFRAAQPFFDILATEKAADTEPSHVFQKPKPLRLPAVLLGLVLLVFSKSFAQNQVPQTVLRGTVADVETGEKLPYVSVSLKSRTAGTSTDSLGFFTFKIAAPAAPDDSLQISFVGFTTQTFALSGKAEQVFSVKLGSNAALLGEVTVTADPDPGKSFMKKVVARKPQNDPGRLPEWQANRWNRMELALDNVRPDAPGSQKLRAQMQEVFNKMDTANVGQDQLPIYFSESIGRRRHAGADETDDISAKKYLGLETDRLTRYLEKFSLRVSIYDNWIYALQKTFAAPVSDGGLAFYKYYIEDTLRSETGQKVFKIQFIPRRSRETAFAGFLWVEDSTFAVRRFEMHLAKDANLNFVDSISLAGEFALTDIGKGQKLYLPTRNETFVRFESGMELLGIPVKTRPDALRVSCRNTDTFYDWNIGKPAPAADGSPAPRTTLFDQTQLTQDVDFWKKNRPDSLTRHEQAIYSMIDTMRNTPRFRRTTQLAALVGTGMWDFKNKFRVGSYPSVFSKNAVEGVRLRLDFETLPGLNPDWNVFSTVAYGTRDRRLKGSVKIQHVNNNTPWSKTTLTLRSDLDHGMEDDELNLDNAVTSVFSKNLPPVRTYIKEFKIAQEQQLGKYLMNTTAVSYREYDPVFDFKYHPENWSEATGGAPTDLLHKLPLTEVSTKFRWAFGEQAYRYNFNRIIRSTRFPAVTLGYVFGFETAQTQFAYHKIMAGISQNLKLPPKSTFYYDLTASQTFGTLPFLLLNVPRGNQYYVASRYAFNTMQPYEFVSDRSVSLHTRLSGGGILLDRIPLLAEMGWRERLSFNAFYGDLSQKNRDFNAHSTFAVTEKTPFMEAGIGVENIFRVLSIEYIRRLNYFAPGVPTSGVFVGITLQF